MRGNETSAQADWFVDPAGGDLHLRPTASGIIDQADPLANVADDYDGDARPIGLASDIGADEYASSGPAWRLLLPLAAEEVK